MHRTNAHPFSRALASLVFLSLGLSGCGGGGRTTVPALPVPVSVPSSGPIALVSTQVTSLNLGTPVATAAKLRVPVSGDNHVGIVIMHPFSSYVDFQGCDALAQRGFTTLCVDSAYTNKQTTYYGYEQHVPAIAAAVQYLRSQPTIKKVLLFGHSMGAPMMAFYQNVAENGMGVCTGPEKIIPCVTTNLLGLPAADGIILFDSHLGESLATFTYVDPAVINNTLGQRDPTLDMFSAANGYNAATNGAFYTDAFVQSFLAAQAARNALLISQAQNLLAQERTVAGDPTKMGDDIPFTVVGASAARIWQPDVNLLACTQQPIIFLSQSGRRPMQLGCSVRPPSGAATSGLSASSTLNVNVHIWLGAHALRTKGPYSQTNNDLTGIDYTSTATSSVGNITGVSKPMLILANSGHYFLRPDEIVYQAARMADKTFAIEEGAVHGGTECSACEQLLGLQTPVGSTSFGYFGDTFSRTMDFMAEWIRKRY